MEAQNGTVGAVEVTISVPPGHDLEDRPPKEGVRITCTVREPLHTDERMLKWLAYEALMRELDHDLSDSVEEYRALLRDAASFPWRRVYRPGMTIRVRSSGLKGVVLDVLEYDGPRYDLLVNVPGDPILEGGGTLAPWNAVPHEDPADGHPPG